MITTVYDAFGRQFISTDAAGLTLTNEYNENDQLVAIQYPVVAGAPPDSPATSIRYAYDSNNAQMQRFVTDRANLISQIGYDKRLNRISAITSWGALTTYGYDDLGRQTTETNALNEVTQNVFDCFNHLVATIFPDHISGTQERIEYRAYDQFGKMTNHWGTTAYDAAYTFDLVGNRTSVTDGMGNCTRWEYDGRNRPVREIYADGSDVRYAYDTTGHCVRKVNADASVTRYTFNSSGLITHVFYPNQSEVDFTYDAMGRPVLMVDGQGTNSWWYDSAGRVRSNSQSSVNCLVSYDYDAEGRRVGMAVASDGDNQPWLIRYGYDYSGRLASVTDQQISELPFSYYWATNANHVVGLAYPFGMSTAYHYDDLGRISSMRVFDKRGSEVGRFDYRFNNAGQQVSLAMLTGKNDFEYDGKRRLVTAQRFTAASRLDTNWNFRYVYDANGNFRSWTDPQGVHRVVANDLNEYTLINDSQEHVLKYGRDGEMSTYDTTSYRYDGAQRLIGISDESGTISLTYDGIGRRTALVDTPHQSDGEKRKYVYDNGQWVVCSSTASEDVKITRGMNWSMDGQAMGGILAVRSSQGLTLLVADPQGNVRLEQDATSETLTAHDYTPFGFERGLSAEVQPFGYSSKEHIGDSGLLDFARRIYNPQIGRWLTRDPAGIFGGINLFAYANNDPTDLIDPTGMLPEMFGPTIPTVLKPDDVNPWPDDKQPGQTKASIGAYFTVPADCAKCPITIKFDLGGPATIPVYSWCRPKMPSCSGDSCKHEEERLNMIWSRYREWLGNISPYIGVCAAPDTLVCWEKKVKLYNDLFVNNITLDQNKLQCSDYRADYNIWHLGVSMIMGGDCNAYKYSACKSFIKQRDKIDIINKQISDLGSCDSCSSPAPSPSPSPTP